MLNRDNKKDVEMSDVSVGRLITILSLYPPDMKIIARGNDADFYYLWSRDINIVQWAGADVLEIDGFK